MSDARWDDVERWIRDRIVPDDEVLRAAVERSTAEGLPSIQVDPPSGKLLNLIARMIGAKRVFELGSGYGYSTAWFAKAVQENGGGEVHHVVWDEGLSQKARGSSRRSPRA